MNLNLTGRQYREQRIKKLLQERDECLLIVRNPSYKLTASREAKKKIGRAYTRLAEIKQELIDFGVEP